MIKTILKKTLNKFGYDFNKTEHDPGMELYERLYPMDSIEQKRFYSISAGAFAHPCWTNVYNPGGWYDENKNNQTHVMPFDILALKPMPVESNTAEVVYNNHTIEHVSNDAVQHLFNEAFRILKKGGTLRISTPDIELAYRAWRENDRDYFFWIKNYSEKKDYEAVMLNQPLNKASNAQIFLEDFATTACVLHADGADKRITDEELEKIFAEMKFEDALDYCIARCSPEKQRKYPFNDINWFNFNKLQLMLARAGFNKIWRSAYLQSYCPVLRNGAYFDRKLPMLSMFVEAKK